MAGSILAGLFSLLVCAQQADPATPAVVQPGATGQPTRTLPPSTRATPPPHSPADVQFMQGMIMRHAQAAEMTTQYCRRAAGASECRNPIAGPGGNPEATCPVIFREENLLAISLL